MDFLSLTDDSGGFNDLNIVLIIVAAVGFFLWLSTICIAFCICCCKRKGTGVEKDQEIGLQLVNGQPHCPPPSGQAPHPEENTVKEDPYDIAPKLKEKQLHQPDTKLNDQLLSSRANHVEPSKSVDSVKSQSSPDYLEPKPVTNQTATPLTKNTANPPKSRSTSLTEGPPHQSGRGLGQPETGSKRKTSSTNDPSVDTEGSVDFRDQLKMVLARAGNSARDDPSNDGINGNSKVPTSSDEEKKVERMISDEFQYDAVE